MTNRRMWRTAQATALLALMTAGIIPAIGTVPSAEAQDNPPFWLELEEVGQGFDEPVYLTDAPGGGDRLFVVEKAGVIRILEDEEILPEPFLDLSPLVESEEYEQGMLGLAFHPNYAENGYFYVTYSSTTEDWTLARYQVSNDPDRADPDSAARLITIPHPDIMHYGGMLEFGPDGYLYVSTGDGGGAFDPLGNGQDRSTLLGSILRIDPSTEPVQGEDDLYDVPLDNPFVGDPDARPEIWAYGFRNPWRFSFDRLTGDLYIGDVGQGRWEEVNFQPADSDGGENYGWPITEATHCTRYFPDCDTSLYQLPVAEYGHADGCSVTGGYVYRGNPDSPIYGSYLFADHCEGKVWTLDREENGGWTTELRLDTGLAISSFGEDRDGNLYVLGLYGGSVYRVSATTVHPTPVLDYVIPGSVPAGTVGCRVELTGYNFVNDATAYWNGEERPTTTVDSTTLVVDLTTFDLEDDGTARITVTNPVPGGGKSDGVLLDTSSGVLTRTAIPDRWARTDQPVADGQTSRTWMWGEAGLTCGMSEPYADAPDGERIVQYFDKTRMEITDPDGDPDSDWFVTNGLLVQEMISGRLQTGDAAYEQREPAGTNIAGDINDPTGPTYTTFAGLLDEPPRATGTVIQQRIDRDGAITEDPELAEYDVIAERHVPETDHTIAEPFWSFMTASGQVWEGGDIVEAPLFENPFYATGYPISEAYWATVNVGETPRNILIQPFERRVLTYTPDNPEGWRVEAGNVGRHYYRWRYGDLPSTAVD